VKINQLSHIELVIAQSIIKKKIYLFGGQIYNGPDGYLFNNDLHTFDIETKKWEEVETTGDIPSKRSQHSSILYKNFLFIIGGHDSNYFYRDFYYLNLNNLEWKKFDLNISNLSINYKGIFSAQISTILSDDMILVHGWDDKNEFLIDLKNKNIKKKESVYEKKK